VVADHGGDPRPEPLDRAGARRGMIRRPLLVAVVLLLVACSSPGSATPNPSPRPALEASLVASEIVVGDTRFPLGILDQNTPVSDAIVRVRFFYLGRNGQEAKGEANAPFRGEGLHGAGVYVAQAKFDRAGDWGAEVTAQRPSGTHAVIPLGFNVVASPVVPAVGQPAPRSQSPTVRSAPDVSYIDSGSPPNDMHQVSIADAIAAKKPTLVIFASPAFCTSRICGPEVGVVQSLEPTYRDRLTFIHIEVYRDFKPDPSKRQLAPTVLEWRLGTEPWIFLIDRDGIIRARFEGPTAADEVKAAIDRLLVA